MSVKSSNSQTATLAFDHTLLSTTDSGVYILVVDAANLVNGETLKLTIRRKVRTGDTIRDARSVVYQHGQSIPILEVGPITCPFGADFILRQEGGTGRAFPWSVEKLD
jgi:hypothetical protein